jgi:hypothetical protein
LTDDTLPRNAEEDDFPQHCHWFCFSTNFVSNLKITPSQLKGQTEFSNMAEGIDRKAEGWFIHPVSSPGLC